MTMHITQSALLFIPWPSSLKNLAGRVVKHWPSRASCQILPDGFSPFSATAEKNYIFLFHARSFLYAAIIIDALHEAENKTSYKHFWAHSIMTGLILERTFLEEPRAKFRLAIKIRCV